MSRPFSWGFSVKIGTIFEDSHVGLHLWLQAIYLIAASKKHQREPAAPRARGHSENRVVYGSPHPPRDGGTAEGKMGEDGGVVEVDETYIGRKPGADKARAGAGHKEAVLALVERKGGVRSFHVSCITGNNLRSTLFGNISPKARLMTDEARWYWKIGSGGMRRMLGASVTGPAEAAGSTTASSRVSCGGTGTSGGTSVISGFRPCGIRAVTKLQT